MIEVGKTYVVTVGEYEGRYVVPMFIEEGGKYCCRFTGKYAADKAASIEHHILITIAEYKKRQLNET